MTADFSFSIVIPTFQRKDVVCDAIRAVAQIEYSGPLELIVVIDGSDDGTLEAVEAIHCPFPKRVIWHENVGLSATRNRGAAAATGDVILFLDDDMISQPDIIEQHARSHRQGAQAVLGHIPLDSGSPPGVLARGIRQWAEDRARNLALGAELTLFDLLGGHLSIRREVFHEIGGFDEAFTAGGTYGNEDIDFGLRLLGRYRLEFNVSAVAGHRYVVSPAQHMQQYFEAGRADVAFARKHPQEGRELFRLHGSDRLRTRAILMPLAACGLGSIVWKIGVWLAAQDERVPSALRPILSRLFFMARDTVYWSGVRSAGGVPASRHVLILCYHAITDLSSDPVLAQYGIPPREFARQLDRLIERGFAFLSPSEFASLLQGKGLVPRRAAFLTFDDCYVELAEVFPDIMRPRAASALAFAVSGNVGRTNDWDRVAGARPLLLLDGAQMLALTEAGMEFGCHSRSHRAMVDLSDEELVQETAGSAAELEALGLPRPRFFAYPFGRRDTRSRRAVCDAGFMAAFGLRDGLASAASERFDLPRVEILAKDGSARFWLKTTFPHTFAAIRWVVSIYKRAWRKALRIARRPLASNG